ncbi:MAG TPA: GAF domain-containing protein [Candidatus Binatia bacterium]|nr:GAF domain-containing protein [Candidatus Binatia bacterium]
MARARLHDADAWGSLRDLPLGPEGLERAARSIREASPRHSSVYLYGLDGDALELRAFSGRPTDHARIGIGDGVCGRAVATGGDQVVTDVSGDPDYIACSPRTRSECVVLVRRDGRLVGQIDIDSDVPAAFTAEAVRSLQAAAELIAPLF